MSEENPKGFQITRTVPLDEIDGAARVLDPIFVGACHGQNVHSLFLKDYKPTNW